MSIWGGWKGNPDAPSGADRGVPEFLQYFSVTLVHQTVEAEVSLVKVLQILNVVS
jgi:hypothetical protein